MYVLFQGYRFVFPSSSREALLTLVVVTPVRELFVLVHLVFVSVVICVVASVVVRVVFFIILFLSFPLSPVSVFIFFFRIHVESPWLRKFI